MSDYTSHELGFMNATELLEHYRNKTLSPVEVTRTMLDRIEQLNPQINAVYAVDEEGAMAEAKASEERWFKRRTLRPIRRYSDYS